MFKHWKLLFEIPYQNSDPLDQTSLVLLQKKEKKKKKNKT